MRAALHNLGCKVNAYETEAMQQLLEEAGYTIVPFEEEADVYLVNTCSVTNIADRKSRQMLHRAKAKNPDAVVVAAGCYAEAAGEELLRDEAVDILIGNHQKKDLPEILARWFAGNREETELPDIAKVREYESLSISRTSGHTRAFIKVQDGCNQFCSYCIIPYTRGRVRSRDPKEVAGEIGRLAAGGYREAVLTGIHLSSYGTDFGPEGPKLIDLIRSVHDTPGIERIRLGSLEPRIVTEEFVRELSGMEKVCPHFHLSLQSGCDTVLGRMNRRYGTREYRERCGLLRKYYGDPAITTDVIAGFPGETEEEFADTLKFVREIGFYEMHVFKYSARRGTRAAAMSGQVAEQVKTERSRRLIELGEKMSGEYRARRLGKPDSLLLEEETVIGKERYMTGFTREYVRGAVKTEKGAGELVRGEFQKFLRNDLLIFGEK